MKLLDHGPVVLAVEDIPYVLSGVAKPRKDTMHQSFEQNPSGSCNQTPGNPQCRAYIDRTSSLIDIDESMKQGGGRRGGQRVRDNAYWPIQICKYLSVCFICMRMNIDMHAYCINGYNITHIH